MKSAKEENMTYQSLKIYRAPKELEPGSFICNMLFRFDSNLLGRCFP
jgi:hypothetical protein